MGIELVSFDADGTIVDNGYVNSFWFQELPELYARKNGVEFDEARNTLISYYDEIGDEDIRWYEPKYWFERFDLEESPREVIERIQVPENVRLYEDALDVTKKLGENYKLIVTSNAPRIFLDYALERVQGRFAKIYSCVSDFGEVKKDAGVYRKVLKEMGVAPERAIHVGDHWKFDFKVPRAIGMGTFYIERNGDPPRREEGVLTDLRDMESNIAEMEDAS
jgi:putative hydrolase of the HAD superfamily